MCRHKYKAGSLKLFSMSKALWKERRETESLLPWEFGSGKVSLATKCITVVFPRGSLRASGGGKERDTELQKDFSVILSLKRRSTSVFKGSLTSWITGLLFSVMHNTWMSHGMELQYIITTKEREDNNYSLAASSNNNWGWWDFLAWK